MKPVDVFFETITLDDLQSYESQEEDSECPPVRPEYVFGVGEEDSIRCADGIWRPFRDAAFCEIRPEETTEMENDYTGHWREGYIEH